MAHSSDVVDDVSGDGRDDVSDEMGGDRVHRPRRDGRRQGTSAPARWAEWMMSPAMAGMMSLARWAEAGRVGPGEMGRHVFRAGGGAATTRVRRRQGASAPARWAGVCFVHGEEQ
jgi:hypothetical protein